MASSPSSMFMSSPSLSSSTPSSQRSSISTVIPSSLSTDDDEEESVEDDWVVVGGDWWRLPFNAVPWGYRKQYQWSLEGVRYAIHPKPLHYHDALYNDKYGVFDGSGGVGEGGVLASDGCGEELSRTLVGVHGAEDVIGQYEAGVGIQFLSTPFQPLSLSDSELHSEFSPSGDLLFEGEIDEEDLALAQKRWDHQVRSLFDGVLKRVEALDLSFNPSDNDRKLWDLDKIDELPSSSSDSSRTSTSPDVGDLSYSVLSVESDPPPSTPHNDKKSYAAVVFDETKPRPSLHGRKLVAPSPAKVLNASALSFIPASIIPPSSPSPSMDSQSYTSPTYEFHFPSLSSQQPTTTAPASAASSGQLGTISLPPNLEKDQEGFYNEIPSSSSASVSSSAARSHTSTRTATPKKERPSASLLPAFLTDVSSSVGGGLPNSRSKTREIVDRLRSAGAERKRGKTDFVAKNLFLGLEHREGGTEAGLGGGEDAGVVGGNGKEGEGLMSTTLTFESQADKLAAIDGWITSVENEAIAAEHHSQHLQDGWIEGMSKVYSLTTPNPSTTRSNHRSSRSTATSTSNAKKHGRSTSTSTRTTTTSSSGSGGSGMTPTTPSSVSSSINTTTTFPSPASSMTSFGGGMLPLPPPLTSCVGTSPTSSIGFGAPLPPISPTSTATSQPSYQHSPYGILQVPPSSSTTPFLPYGVVVNSTSSSTPAYSLSSIPQISPIQAQAAYMQMQLQMQMQAQAQQWQQLQMQQQFGFGVGVGIGGYGGVYGVGGATATSTPGGFMAPPGVGVSGYEGSGRR